MAKKLILLLLLIPIIIMIGLFAATKTISVMVDIPISGISLNDSGAHIYLDLDKQETHTLDYTVYPTNAKEGNKAVFATTESVKGKNLAKLDFVLTGGNVSIIPKSTGSAKVYLTTVEGGYRDSVTVHVTSTELKSISSSPSSDRIAVGEKAYISTVFEPKSPSNTILEYSSDNNLVASVDDKGIISANGAGTATITVTSYYNPEISCKLTIEVYNKKLITLAGASDVLNDSGEFTLSAATELIDNFTHEKITLRAFDASGNEIPPSVLSLSLVVKDAAAGHFAIAYEFKDNGYEGKFTVKASYDDENTDFTASFECVKIKKDSVEVTLSFDDGGESFVNVGDGRFVNFSKAPSEAACTFEASSDNNGVISNVKVLKSRVTYSALKPGVATITLKATLIDNPEKTAEAKIKIYVSPGESFSITDPEISKSKNESEPLRSPIEDVITIGKYEYTNSGSYTDTTTTLTENSDNKLVLSYISQYKGGYDKSFLDNVRWEVEPKYRERLGITADGVLYFRDNSDSFDEIVEFRAVFGSTENEKNTIFASYDIRCVSGGINVYSYIDLLRASKDGNKRSIILRNSITDDFGKYSADGDFLPKQEGVVYTTMHTTYDDNYYINIGKQDEARIKILLSFKSSVYGNGHTINANNLANGIDSTGQLSADAIFRGPLNFVAMSDSGTSISVKGQDNICFALYEGAKLNNVNLYGCTLTPEDNGTINLADPAITYSGTVVEILGDSTSIEYSRISSGRTVIRAFGDANDSEKKIHVNIKNTVLSEAREFVMRVGSNRFVTASDAFETPSPTIPGATDTTHKNKGNYNTAFSETDRNSYDEGFINTFITLESSVLRNAGLFAIGVDSHFASHALADGDEFVYSDGLPSGVSSLFKTEDGKSLLKDWKNLSKTSYGAKIKFVGEVNLYTWKPLSEVDSSTLIEKPADKVLENLQNDNFKQLIGMLNFDIQAMVKAYNGKLNQNESKIIKKINGQDYVHGGIVFFGGGKNYGIFDSTEASGYSKNLTAHQVSLDATGAGHLSYAAGSEDFYFFMFDESSYNSSTDDSIIYTKGN